MVTNPNHLNLFAFRANCFPDLQHLGRSNGICAVIVVCMLSVEVPSFMGCAGARHSVALREGLGLFDSLIPVDPDSVLSMYDREDPSTFRERFAYELLSVQKYIDSLNRRLPSLCRIDTLAIDHSPENFGNAARSGRTVFLSSSYFFLYRDPAILRGAVAHEYGHLLYEQISERERRTVDSIWGGVRDAALFYLFRDGEYTGNARFGGHPDESPEELFASAFNLFHNNNAEVLARLEFVDPSHHRLLFQLRALVFSVVYQ